MKKEVIIGAAMLAIGVVTGWLCNNHFRGEVEMVEKVDTLIVRDTTVIEKPKAVFSRIVDTMLVEVTQNDTLYISLPRESKTYGDERYTAVVSGYQPSLDRLDIYVENKIITKYIMPEPAKPKTHYLSIGAEAVLSRSPYLPVYLEYEEMVHKNIGLSARVQYDVISKSAGVGIGARVQIGW